MASNAHAKMTSEAKAALDAFYRDKMGFDPSKLDEAGFAQHEAEMTKAEKALAPALKIPLNEAQQAENEAARAASVAKGEKTYSPPHGEYGNPWRDEINSRGGYDPTDAKHLAIFNRWYNGEMPRELDWAAIKKAGVSDEAIAAKKASLADDFARDSGDRYALLTRPPSATMEMEPETIAAAPPKAKGKDGKSSKAAPLQPASQQTTVAGEPGEEKAYGVRDGNRIRLIHVRKGV